MSETKQNTNSETLTFDEFRENILKDYSSVYLSSKLQVLHEYKELVKDENINIWEKGKELIFLALQKVKTETDFSAENIFNIKYLLGLGVSARLHENEMVSQLKSLNQKTNDVVFWTLHKKDFPARYVIDTLNGAHRMNLPFAFTIVEDDDELIPSDNKISRYYVNKVLNEVELTDIFQADATDYTSLCNACADGINLCRNESKPILIHIKISSLKGNNEFSDAVLQFRNWIIQTEVLSNEELIKLEKNLSDKADHLKTKVARDCMRLSMKVL